VASAYRPIARAIGISLQNRPCPKGGFGPGGLSGAPGWPEEYQYTCILGPGAIGLYALQIAKAFGAPQVIIVGTRASRLEVAQRLGADAVVDSTSGDLISQIQAITRGRGVDLIIEATGSHLAISQAIAIGTKRSRIVLAGVFHKEATIDASRLMRNEMVITGSLCYSLLEFDYSMNMIESGKVLTKHIITHHLPLVAINEALGLITSRQAIKVMLHP